MVASSTFRLSQQQTAQHTGLNHATQHSDSRRTAHRVHPGPQGFRSGARRPHPRTHQSEASREGSGRAPRLRRPRPSATLTWCHPRPATGRFSKRNSVCLLTWTTKAAHRPWRHPPPAHSARDWEHTGGAIYLCPGAFPGTPPPPQSRRRCFATFFLAAEESPTSEGLQTKRFWSLAEEKLAGFQCSWQTLGGLHFSICRREQRCVCLHRSMAPPPAQRHYGRGWALESVRLAARSECKCYVTHYQM